MKQQTLEEAINEIGGVHPDWKPLECFKKGFKEGAIWQEKQSHWISVKDRLPEEGNPVLIRLKDGVVRLASYDIDEDSNIYFWDDNYAYETFRPWDVTHWREIPSFDEILEANKDVLERIKEKEVNHG